MDYARALVEHPMWTQWRKGMVDDAGCVCSVDGIKMGKARLPDINHPATKGWLLHMLREATEDASAWAVSDGEMWSAEADYLEMDGPWNFPAAATEGEALAAALLAVWGQA